MTGKELLGRLNSSTSSNQGPSDHRSSDHRSGELFAKLYGRANIEAARRRYISLVEGLIKDTPDSFPRNEFPETGGDVRIFTAAGRTELGGNHTDHNRGKVLAASIQMDSVAVVAPRRDKKIVYRSSGYKDVIIDISDLSPRDEETGHSASLIRGVAAEFAARGTPVGGFTANADSTVLSGSGLSSSAALEVVLAKIFDCLYCGGKRGALELAQIGQKAENTYFGKPCGLMDQAASASGGVAAIDFEDTQNPKLTKLDFDLSAAGFTLCVVDTHGSHADLTPDYAAIPREMKSVASFFGKSVLREIDVKTVMEKLPELRKAAGDRAVIRAFHFFDENQRVDAMVQAIRQMKDFLEPEAGQAALGTYLDLVNKSGDSSWEMLQNIYPPQHPNEQGLTMALVLTRYFLKKFCGGQGVCRVHGGGFAGTIQVYLPIDAMNGYREYIETYFGKNSLTELMIRSTGTAELEF